MSTTIWTFLRLKNQPKNGINKDVHQFFKKRKHQEFVFKSKKIRKKKQNMCDRIMIQKKKEMQELQLNELMYKVQNYYERILVWGIINI